MTAYESPAAATYIRSTNGRGSSFWPSHTRRRRERHLVLPDEVLGMGADLGDERGTLHGAQHAAEDWLPADAAGTCA